MLLARKETLLPAEYSSVGLPLLESDSRLLQENWGDEEKSINFKIKRRTCYLSLEMCPT